MSTSFGSTTSAPPASTDVAAPAWKVVMEPVGQNPFDANETDPSKDKDKHGLNQSGIIVYLVNGTRQEEVDRVNFVRRNSKQPDLGFKAALKESLVTAQDAVDALNDTEAFLAAAREEARTKVADAERKAQEARDRLLPTS